MTPRIEAPATQADSAIIDPELAAEERERRREIGGICAALFVLGALLSLTTSRIVDPDPPNWIYLITVGSMLAGFACLRIDWEKRTNCSFHIVAVVATLMIALWAWGVGTEGQAYQAYYVMIAVFAAYVFRRRVAIVAQLALISVATLAPAVYEPDTARETFLNSLVLIPSLLIAASMVVYLRETLSERREAYRQESRRDPLTGVGNYRTLREALTYEIARHQRQGRRFAVMVLDLDGFKAINDHLGHLEGDRLLKEAAAVLSETVRAQDTVARQGGDEFCVLAPETGPAEAGAMAERIERAMERIKVGASDTLAITTGWAIYPDDGTDPDALVSNADLVLREDKSERRERARTVQEILEGR
jgi:diguanylate cyclase (GGDEF)-like protein